MHTIAGTPCRATRVAADFLDFIAFCRCSSGVAPHPLKILVSHLPPPLAPGGVAPKFGSEKVSHYTGVSQVQLRVSRYTVQLSSKGTTKKLCDKDFAEHSGELSGAICLKTLVLLGNDPVAPRIVQKILWCCLCDFFWLCESFLAPDDGVCQCQPMSSSFFKSLLHRILHVNVAPALFSLVWRLCGSDGRVNATGPGLFLLKILGLHVSGILHA